MDDLIYVAPAQEQSVFFARWIIGHRLDHRVSYPGYMLTPGEYAAVPPELLEGAIVDGFVFGVESPQPEPSKVPQGGDGKAPADKPRRSRKRASGRSTGVPGPVPQVPGQMSLDEKDPGVQSGG